MVKVTIVYDNTSIRNDLQSDWGFSALVETESRRILFDTGADGSILLANLRALGIAPERINEVFISHAHADHTGGLPTLLAQNDQLTVWVPPSFRGEMRAGKVTEICDLGQFHEGMYSTGELEGIEQSLCVSTKKGIVIVAGCSHPKMERILAAASQFGTLYGIIGGLHGTRPESLKVLDLICPTHCTEFKREMESLYPQKYIEGGAGRVIEIL